MSSLTRCTPPGRAPKPLPLTQLLRVLVFLSAMLVFGVAHLSLRFSVNQLETETNQLQSIQSQLTSEVKALQGKNEALRRPEQLYEYASNQLGMVPYRTSERRVLRLSSAVYARYEGSRTADSPMLAMNSDSQQKERAAWLERLSERAGLVSQAQATESH